jgi:hypothetical protein
LPSWLPRPSPTFIRESTGFIADVKFLDDVDPDELVVRAGGDPEHVLRFSPGWFHKLASIALEAR